MNVSCNLKYPHKKHSEVNMQNVPFQHYPSVLAFTQAFGFGLVSIWFQISNGCLFNFHLG